MQDRFKFRFWDKETQTMQKIPMVELRHRITLDKIFADDRVIFMQCTGLKDKNGLNLLFECDIINTEGIKIGNCYENEYLLKDTTNFVIKGMGTKEWRNSEQEAIKRGCYYAE